MAEASLSKDEMPSRKDIVVALCIMPAVKMLTSLYIYSCLPLYMVERNLDLLNLGLCAGLALCTRTIIPLIVVKFMPLERLVLPVFLMALASGILNAVFTDVALTLYVNIFCVMLLPGRSTFQAAVVQVWPSDRIRALRLYESFYTLGYCMSSLYGATIYTIGGWKLCIWLQVSILAVSIILGCTVRVLQPWRTTTHPKPFGVGTKTVEHSQQGSVAASSMTTKEAQDTWWKLALFIGIGSGVTIYAYASEWSIYLVYLTDRFGLGVLPIGIGQMSGDIGGAVILMTSMLSGKKLACTSSNTKAAACGGAFCSLPWSMIWLGLLYASAYVLFLSSTMELAITGQVMMGTMYVLLQQGCTELVEWCCQSCNAANASDAATSQRRYQKYAATADACFSTGCALGSVLPFVIMEQLSAEWVCYIVAALVFGYTLAFASVFLCRSCRGKPVRAVTSPADDASEEVSI